MQLFNLISIVANDLSPEEFKVHLACGNGGDNPMDAFLSGRFEEWQSWQSRRNFQRRYILSLIGFGADRWLFAGVYESNSCSKRKIKGMFLYETKPTEYLSEFIGRLIVKYKRKSRNSYLNFENIRDGIEIEEIMPKALSIKEFPGYSDVLIVHDVLDAIIGQDLATWKAALSNTKGVYLITDRQTGRLYVGSATGDMKIWQRWTDYAKDGHGGNKKLKDIILQNGEPYKYNFQYSILETFGARVSDEYIRERESFWKEVLCSKLHGYNDN